MSFEMTPFDEITSAIPVVTPFEAMWNEAAEMLLATHPEGFEVEEIGRIAFDSLSDAEKAEALDVLFYTYWAATLADRETRAAQSGGGS